MTGLSIRAANIQLAALAAAAAGGTVRIYAGDRPKNADGEAEDMVLSEHRMSEPAFDDPAGGMIVARTIETDDDASGTGIPTWFRVSTKSGDALWDGDCGPGGDMQFDAPMITRHSRVEIESLIHVLPIQRGQ